MDESQLKEARRQMREDRLARDRAEGAHQSLFSHSLQAGWSLLSSKCLVDGSCSIKSWPIPLPVFEQPANWEST